MADQKVSADQDNCREWQKCTPFGHDQFHECHRTPDVPGECANIACEPPPKAPLKKLSNDNTAFGIIVYLLEILWDISFRNVAPFR
jgi:hypothetical protein